MHITPAHISLDNPPNAKLAAVAQAAAILIDNGCVEEPFRYGIIAREAMGNTYLGHGIAVPHGVPQTERYIKKDSIAFVRTAEGGVPWGPEAERVDTVIAIAVKSGNYMRVLRRITGLMNTPEHLALLKESDNPQEIIDLLTANIETPADTPNTANDDDGNAIFRQGIVYPHAQGLHLHPASTLSELAKELGGGIRVQLENGKSADAQSVSELLALDVIQGQAITISADDPQTVNSVVAHFRLESEAPEEDLLPPETHQPETPPRKTDKTAWYIGAAVALAGLIYLLTR